MNTPLITRITAIILLAGRACGYDIPARELTMPPHNTPAINGPTVFGVRPRSPVLYAVPATGARPMGFSADGLPVGLAIDGDSGRITGTLSQPGEYPVTLQATNAFGRATRRFRIVVGDRISLTPPMGWNSWNCWAGAVDQEKVLRSARAMVASGLAQHGWSYINIDDTWQGKRTGRDHALQGCEKFPDLKGLFKELHRMGLKAGLYSTPWITSYAGRPGGSSASATGVWAQSLSNQQNHVCGKYSFARADAQQWADWEIDYLKYDWFPNDEEHVIEMSRALRDTGRDIIFSLSNSAAHTNAAIWSRWANCWRVTNDIWDRWDQTDEAWQYSVSEIGFSLDRWAPYAGPGHWNDPDLLVLGQVGWGKALHPTTLTPDEQGSHFSLWCMLAAPLLLGCDLEHLDAFTVSLLSNDEVIAINQDALGKQATRVATVGPVDVYMKPLEDGSHALGFFNRDSTTQSIRFTKLSALGLSRKLSVRDLWRRRDLPEIANPDVQPLAMTIPGHGVQLYKLTQVKSEHF